jgi:lysophospholipase L1-like esterase
MPTTRALHEANTPAARDSQDWSARQRLLEVRIGSAAEKGGATMLFLGDSITQGWEAEGRLVWEEFFAPRGAVNLGISGDRTQHVLWRVQNGALERLRETVKLAVVLIGTNNLASDTPEQIAQGVSAILSELAARLPGARVLLLGILPRGGIPAEKIARTNQLISGAAAAHRAEYLDIGAGFVQADGSISPGIMPDQLHLSAEGYAIWARAIEPHVSRLMGGR